MPSQKEINKRYWNEYTAKASDFYKRKMFALVSNGEEYSETHAGSLLEGDLHGEPTPHHWMWKLPSLSVPEYPDMHYEFLIEYDIFEPHVGIYYGCKCVTMPGANHDEAIRISNLHWETLRPVVTAVLNNIFVDKDFTHRFKVTNNAENNTYWPFWISLYEDEDIIKLGKEALTRIRDIYSRMLLGETLSSPEKIKKGREVATRFTESAYQTLLSDWNKIFTGVNVKPKRKPAEIFDEFIVKAMKKGWIHPDPIYGSKSRAYRFQGLNDNSEEDYGYYFPKMIRALREYIEEVALSKEDRERYLKHKEGKRGGKGGIPWRSLTRIFLTWDGRLYEENSLRNSIRDDKAKGGPDWPLLIEELMGEDNEL